MKTIFTIIFLLCGIFLQAQNVDSLIRAGEQLYHQKEYWKARNDFTFPNNIKRISTTISP